MLPDKQELLSLFRRMVKYGDNFAILLLAFAPWVIGASGAAILFEWLALKLSIPSFVIGITLKAMLSIVPLFPTLYIWRHRNEFGGDSGVTHGVMDCCFTIWIICIAVAFAADWNNAN